MKRMAMTILVDVPEAWLEENVVTSVMASIEQRGLFTDTEMRNPTLDSVWEHEATKKTNARRAKH